MTEFKDFSGRCEAIELNNNRRKMTFLTPEGEKLYLSDFADKDGVFSKSPEIGKYYAGKYSEVVKGEFTYRNLKGIEEAKVPENFVQKAETPIFKGRNPETEAQIRRMNALTQANTLFSTLVSVKKNELGMIPQDEAQGIILRLADVFDKWIQGLAVEEEVR